MKVLAISGSLRAASINSAFCRAAARLAPEGISISVLAGLGDLPLFNPDLEDNLPASVRVLRASISNADALLIASPEYAHGLSCVIKNALDWLVSFEGFVGKPIAVVNTSPRAHHAYDALREVLQTMSAILIPSASITLPLLGACVTENEMVKSPTIAPRITRALAALADALASGRESGPSFPVD